MKKILKLGVTTLLLAFAFTVLSGIGAVKASADTLSADLDNDGTDEVVEWVFDEDSYTITSLTINGKDVYKATKTDPLVTPYGIKVEVIDTATKDNFKELVVGLYEGNGWFAIFRYNKGKITKYVDEKTLTGTSVISQKKKGYISVSDYLFINNLGNIYTTISYKVKSGKAKMVSGQTFKPTKVNSTTSFKATEGMMVYKKADCKTVKGELKLGEKFTILKFKSNKKGEFSLLYIKTKSGVKGWINTDEFEGDEDNEWLAENPPLFS